MAMLLLPQTFYGSFHEHFSSVSDAINRFRKYSLCLQDMLVSMCSHPHEDQRFKEADLTPSLNGWAENWPMCSLAETFWEKFSLS